MALSPCILNCKTVVVGFSGKAGHGKDSAASAIIAKYPSRGIKRYAFADALKVEVFDALLDPSDPYWTTTSFLMHVLPKPPEHWTSKRLKINWVNVNKAELGNLLQHYGMEYRRSQDPFYWINKVRTEIEQDRPTFAFITDVRYKNEIYFVKACCGYTVRVERDGFVAMQRDPQHQSETELDHSRFDYIITVNEGDLEQLLFDSVKVFDEIVADQEPVVMESHAAV